VSGSSKQPAGKSPEGGWDVLQTFLHRLFVRLGAAANDADDLAQESLARVIARPEGASPPSLGFAAVVGRNLWRDGIRRDRRRGRPQGLDVAGEVSDPQAAPPEIAAVREDSARLRSAIEELDPRHRDAIVIVILQHKSYAEAARILGVPRGTVKSRIHYGIERLRLVLDGPASASPTPRVKERSC
jgi:RNA polymerase sigma-70 factor, ECF subfamily